MKKSAIVASPFWDKKGNAHFMNKKGMDILKKLAKPKKVKKPSRKSLIKKLDTLVSLIVRERDGACVLSFLGECNGVLQAGHLFSRVNYSTRWDLTNVWGQCAKHNLLHEHNPYPFFKWFEEKHGKKTLDELNTKHNQLTHYKDSDLLEMLSGLKEEK